MFKRILSKVTVNAEDKDFQYRCAWTEQEHVNRFLTPRYRKGLFTNHDNAKMQVLEKRRGGYPAHLEDQDGRTVKSV